MAIESKNARWTGRQGVLRLLDDLEASGEGVHTIYLSPESSDVSKFLPQEEPWKSQAAYVMSQAGGSETGLAVYVMQNRVVAITPPFPLDSNMLADGVMATPLRRLLNDDLLIGVVMLRLGRYGVGVLRGDSLVASKTATRHVKNRHRKGGSSQRRFERSRERLVREIYDKACEVAQDVISPYLKELDYLMLGGERHTVNSFVKRCRFLQDQSSKTLSRRVAVDQPNHKALLSIHREVWKSRVVTFE
jgi:peptide subunit release factor 1 (eRF1)